MKKTMLNDILEKYNRIENIGIEIENILKKLKKKDLENKEFNEYKKKIILLENEFNEIILELSQNPKSKEILGDEFMVWLKNNFKN